MRMIRYGFSVCYQDENDPCVKLEASWHGFILEELANGGATDMDEAMQEYGPIKRIELVFSPRRNPNE